MKHTTKARLTQAAALCGLLLALIVAMTQVRDSIAVLLRLDPKITGYAGALVAIFVTWYYWIWPLLRKLIRRFKRVPRTKREVFRLRPYDSSPECIRDFKRADLEHERIYSWLISSASHFLYLAGASGTGKSSLLNAYVIPKLKNSAGTLVLIVSGTTEASSRCRSALLEPGIVWTNSRDKEKLSLLDLLAAAAAHLHRTDRKLYIIVDQFEEIMSLYDKDNDSVKEFVHAIQSLASSIELRVLTTLLVMRTDYEGRLRDFGLPTLTLGTNYEVVRLLDIPTSVDFLKTGIVDASLCKKLAKEAAELEETRGRVRYITLNLLGIAACMSPERAKSTWSAGKLLRWTISGWLSEPSVRDLAIPILRTLISEDDRRQARSIQAIADIASVPEKHVLPVLLHFELDGLVRRVQQYNEVWEISHDFVARLLQRSMSEIDASLTNRIMRAMPATVAAVILISTAGIGAVVAREAYRSRSQWIASGGKVETTHDGVYVTFDDGRDVTNEALRWLSIVSERRLITDIVLLNSQVTSLDSMPSLPSLERLWMTNSTRLTSLEGMPPLPSLRLLELSGCTRLGNIRGLEDAPNLESLVLNGCSRLTDIADMPRLDSIRKFELRNCKRLESLDGLSNLKFITSLSIQACNSVENLNGIESNVTVEDFAVADIDSLRDLRALARLKQLKSVSVARCSELRSLQGLEALPELRDLRLGQCESLADLSDLGEMANIASFKVYDCPIDSFSSLPRMPKITELVLSACKISDCDGMSDLSTLRSLSIVFNSEPLDLIFMPPMPNLEILDIGYSRILRFPSLDRLPRLTEFRATLLPDAVPPAEIARHLTTVVLIGSGYASDMEWLEWLYDCDRCPNLKTVVLGTPLLAKWDAERRSDLLLKDVWQWAEELGLSRGRSSREFKLVPME